VSGSQDRIVLKRETAHVAPLWASMTSAPVNARRPPAIHVPPVVPAVPATAPAMVMFDWECGEVIGEPYHRERAACGTRWLE